MLHALQFSLIEHLKSQPFTAVVWHYGGVSYSDKVLPFANVEHRITPVEVLDKRATYEASEYNFQVGVFARNAGELAKLQETTKKHLIGNLPLYNTDGAIPVLTSDSVRCEVRNVVPIPVEAVEGLSGYHRCYIDVAIHVINQL